MVGHYIRKTCTIFYFFMKLKLFRLVMDFNMHMLTKDNTCQAIFVNQI